MNWKNKNNQSIECRNFFFKIIWSTIIYLSGEKKNIHFENFQQMQLDVMIFLLINESMSTTR